jgi:hypothetical protein
LAIDHCDIVGRFSSDSAATQQGQGQTRADGNDGNDDDDNVDDDDEEDEGVLEEPRVLGDWGELHTYST